LLAKFDYKNFLAKINRKSEREFSHGTIVCAMLEMLQNKNVNTQGQFETDLIKYVDQLLVNRKADDYYPDKFFSDKELINHILLAKSIIDSIKKKCEEAGLK